MKSVDLMICDLVTYTGDDEGPITASIEGINEDSDFGIEILGTCERIEDIEPIHLTAEILEKNCWSSTDENLYTIGIEKVYTFFEYSFSAEMLFINDGRIPKPIRYVHELQHALRLCGLDDLADNFKI